MVEVDTTLIEQALENVLHSHSFSSSKQCQALLRYIVEHTLSDEGNMLRERVIGAEVFGRAPDYDTGNDPVVRSRVAEVRKRLAQHYMQEGEPRSGVRIEIPSGSYRAAFDMREVRPQLQEASPALEAAISAWNQKTDVDLESSKNYSASVGSVLPLSPARQTVRWSAWMVSLVLVSVLAVLCVVQFWPFHRKPELDFDLFWNPFTSTSKSAVVYFGGSYTYHLPSRFLDSYRSVHHSQNEGSELIKDIQDGSVLNQTSLVPSNPMIGNGDVAAVARVASTMTRLGRKYDLRYGSDLTVTDLHASPTVLIGGFSNMWTLQLTHDFRYTLDQGGIVDRQQHKLAWVQSGSADGLRNEDYVVVSRIPNSDLGSFMLFIAGINTFSNQAAADVICDPEKIRMITRSLASGWEKKNLQIVLHTTVINQVPIATDVVAVHSW